MGKTALAVFLGLAFVTGLYSQSRLAAPNDPNAAARQGQSEIILNAENSERDIAVWVNNTLVAHVSPKSKEKIIVPDGKNIIEAAETSLKGRQWNIGDKKQVVLDSDFNRITIGLTTRYGRLLNPSIQETVAAGTQGGIGAIAQPVRNTQPARTVRPTAPNDSPIEGAVTRAAGALINDIPGGATVAIISISSEDRALADFVIEELAYFMVDTRKFRVVDRKSLDIIRTEHKLQLSGDVDDNSAVSIGKMLGASIVVTGSIGGSGSTRRLRAKALDVKTAEIVAMASERF